MKITTFLLISCCAMPAMAQRTVTIDECVAYALEHNTQVAQAGLRVENARLQLHTSRYSRLPNLNASVGQSFNFGRGQGRDGTTIDVSSANTSFGLHTSVPLFTGFRIPNQIRADRESLNAAEQDMEAQRRTLGIQITGYYLQALYYKGLADVAAEKVSLDSLNVATVRALVDVGRKSESEVYTAEAGLASSRSTLTTAQGNYRLALLDLKQAMNWEGQDVFAIAPIDDSENESLSARYIDDSIWVEVGAGEHPAVKSAAHQLAAGEYSWRVAKSYYYPQLDFSAGYSNGYYHQFDYANPSFGKQLRLNGQEYMSLSLSIPIFNRFSTRDNARRAKLNVTNLRLQLDETRRQRRKEMEQAQVEAINAREKLRSALAAEKANEAACDCEREKFASGSSTLYALEQAQQQLVSARNEVVQARCEMSLRLRILKIECGEF